MKRSLSGFTIVELLIVIVVIAILATISIVAYNGIQSRSREATLKSDLANAAKQMELANADTSSYPISLPSGVKASPNVIMSLSQTTSGFCINGEYKNSSLRWRYEQTVGGLQEGLCSGAVISGSESGINPNLITDTNFSNISGSGWNFGAQVSTGRTLTTRPGAIGDPYPSRPVLRITNNATTSTGWAVLMSNTIDRNQIAGGKTYMRSYYVRRVGPYTGNVWNFGIKNGDNTTTAIETTGTGVAVTDSWQLINGTSPGLQNAQSTNQIYLPTNTGAYTTSGWTLEFQGFELREQ